MAEQRTRIPVILDTDIGDDIDDTWALAMILNCPELDVKLVVSDYGDTVYRAEIIAKLLEGADRTDVPVGVGHRTKDNGGRQSEWVEGYGLAGYPGIVHEDGVGAIVDTMMAAQEQTTLLCIGPVPNIGLALEREPRIAEKARFVGMHGNVDHLRDAEGRLVAEYNVLCAPAALKSVFEAEWEKTVTPLDTCAKVRLQGEKFAAVRDSDKVLARLVMENYRIWAKHGDIDPDTASSTLFDTVAVYLTYAEDLLQMENLHISVSPEGRFDLDDSAPQVRTRVCDESILVSSQLSSTSFCPACGMTSREGLREDVSS